MSIQSNFPAIKPTLLLDFANVKALDPRVTFSRASTGTFYGTQTAKAEENLLLQSQNYSTSWVVTSLTPVTGKTAPDATSTATEFTASAANAVLTQGYTAIAGSYTFSVFLRRVTGTGDVQIAADNGTWTTKVITGTWARYDVTQTVAAGSKTAGVRVVTDTDAIEVWGAQLEQRSAVTAYTATTTQPITNYVPQLQTAASGVARFDHNPITDESLGLLIEEQRANLFTYSEDFANAAWQPTRASITANTIVAPDGTLTGDKLVEDTTATNTHNVRQNFTVAVGTYTYSVFAKAGERTILQTARLNTNIDLINHSFNLTTGVAIGTGASMISVGNGWYRCVGVITVNTAASTGVLFNLNNGSTTSYTGDGYSGLFLWGAQLEAGAFPTSYIPTVASQVTRSRDDASMTGANFSSWYNQAEGTLYSEAITLAPIPVARAFASINDGTGNNRWTSTVTDSAGPVIRPLRNTNGAGALLTPAPTGAANTTQSGNKVALAITNYEASMCFNGGTAVTATNTYLAPVVTQMQIGQQLTSAFLNGHIRKLSYYPIRCTNAQLQALTS
jgi:hypothetical protein